MITLSHTRARKLAAFSLLAVLVACGGSGSDSTTGINTGGNGGNGGNDGNGGASAATVRIVNGTSSAFDVVTGGTVTVANAGLGYSKSTACLTVNSANPQLALRVSANAAPIAFTPSFTAGHKYMVIAYPTPAGGTLFATIDNAFTPASGQAGVNIFNGVPGSGNFVAISNGMTVGTGQGVGYGTAGAFSNIAPGTQAITFRTDRDPSTVLDGGDQTFSAGVSTTMVVVPGGPGSGYRMFTVTTC